MKKKKILTNDCGDGCLHDHFRTRFHYEPVNSGQTGKASTTTQTACIGWTKSHTLPRPLKEGLKPLSDGGKKNIGGSFGNNRRYWFHPPLAGSSPIGLPLAWVWTTSITVKTTILTIPTKKIMRASVSGRARYWNSSPSTCAPKPIMRGALQTGWRENQLGEESGASLVLGAGFYLPIGNGSTIVSLYYDVIQDDRSPYGNNVGLSVGYTFGF